MSGCYCTGACRITGICPNKSETPYSAVTYYRRKDDPKPLPDIPSPWPTKYDYVSKCPKCGLELSGVMGYVCPQLDCPVFPHAIC